MTEQGKRARIADRDRGEEVDQYALTEVVDEILETSNEVETEQAQDEAVQTQIEENKAEAVAEEKLTVKETSESSCFSSRKDKR